jgi:ubiquinone/menaquinone biosynthesis C-methylase UbiE
MGLYHKLILPKVVDWTCKQRPSMDQRKKVIPFASGNVLEIGIGSGLNLPFYDKDKIKHLTGIDPSEEMWNKKNVDTRILPFEFEFIKAFAENIPADNNSFDTIVMTFTLCSIPDPYKALTEIRRVLKTNGKLLFCEHGKAPDKVVVRWQNFVNPLFKHFGGGCNINRDIPLIIEANGFKMRKMEMMYIPGWKPMCYNYWGTAEIR